MIFLWSFFNFHYFLEDLINILYGKSILNFLNMHLIEKKNGKLNDLIHFNVMDILVLVFREKQ